MSVPARLLRPSTVSTLATLTWMLLAAACGGSSGAPGGHGDAGAAEGGAGDAAPDAGPFADGGSAADGGAGDSGGGQSDGGAADAPAGGDASDGAPSTTYPAFTPDIVQVVDNGGSVLATPVIVTVTWATDPDSASFETFGDELGGSTYWHDLNSEYGVGPATSGASDHVRLTTPPPATLSSQGLVDLIKTGVGAGWPTPTASTIYMVYLDPKTTFTFTSKADAGPSNEVCQQGIGGYHDQIKSGSQELVYAVVPSCTWMKAGSRTEFASHELDEAATDPLPGSAPAYSGYDADHLAYAMFNDFQPEVGDACEIFSSAFYTESEPGFAFSVQRQWSNASAAAGHNPCVPVLGEPFYNTTPFAAEEDAITIDLTSIGGHVHATKGFQAADGQPRTFRLGYFSDAATSGAWTLSASVPSQLPFTDAKGKPIPNGQATFTFDHATGVNGDVTSVTVTPTYGSLGFVYAYVTSSLAGAQAHHYVPMLISLK